MKQHTLFRTGLAAGAACLALPAGWLAMLLVAVAVGLGFNPSGYGYVGMANISTVAGSTKAQLTAAATHDEEVIWEQEVVVMAAMNAPFAEMTGTLGSGKPVINKNDTTKVKGTQIVITTVDQLGGPMVQGNGQRAGQEEQLNPGDFLLTVDIGWFGAGIDNTGKSQTIVGNEWDSISQEGLAVRLAKQQGDDGMQNLKVAATSDNTVYPNGKTIDTIGTADTYAVTLIEKAAGRASDLGALPIDARPPSMKDQMSGRISKYMQFTSQQNMRPIKFDSLYVEAAKLAKAPGDNNPLFTGEYFQYDNNILYPWQVIQHGGIGSIGAVVQPDALLGVDIPAKGTSTDLSAGLTGGGSSAKATATPLRNFFEFFPLYAYKAINGITRTWTPRATYGYCIIINSTDGLVSFFRYTTNDGNKLTGLKRLGSTATGDYLTTVGDVTWTTSATPGNQGYSTVPDGAGFMGLTEGLIPAGSKIYETNSKGVPLGYGFCLGEMALVCGYGRVAIPGGGFKTMINRTEYIEPHGRAYGKGIEVCWGTEAFKRPDSKTPNFVLEVFARKIDGVPVIA